MPDNNQKNRQPQQQNPQEPGRDVEKPRPGQFGGGDQHREPQRGGQMPNQGRPGRQEVERKPEQKPEQKPAQPEQKPGIDRDDEDMGGR